MSEVTGYCAEWYAPQVQLAYCSVGLCVVTSGCSIDRMVAQEAVECSDAVVKLYGTLRLRSSASFVLGWKTASSTAKREKSL